MLGKMVGKAVGLAGMPVASSVTKKVPLYLRLVQDIPTVWHQAIDISFVHRQRLTSYWCRDIHWTCYLEGTVSSSVAAVKQQMAAQSSTVITRLADDVMDTKRHEDEVSRIDKLLSKQRSLKPPTPKSPLYLVSTGGNLWGKGLPINHWIYTRLQ